MRTILTNETYTNQSQSNCLAGNSQLTPTSISYLSFEYETKDFVYSVVIAYIYIKRAI